jgi:hypothetical protein
MTEIRLKRFLNGDDGRPESHQKDGGEDKKDEREDQLYGGLCRLFLHFLTTLRS